MTVYFVTVLLTLIDKSTNRDIADTLLGCSFHETRAKNKSHIFKHLISSALWHDVADRHGHGAAGPINEALARERGREQSTNAHRSCKIIGRLSFLLYKPKKIGCMCCKAHCTGLLRI